MADAPSPQPARGTGVSFPEVDGRRSTTATGSAVFADAARAVDAELAATMERESSWHTAYVDHVRDLLAAEIRAGDAAAGVPAAGLRSLHDRFEFVGPDGTGPVGAALDLPMEPKLRTVTIEGRGRPADRLEVPYGGRALSDGELRRQAADWVDRGIAEPSFADALGRVLDDPGWLAAVDRTFVLFGAAAEMGPLEALSAWGAEIVAIDVPARGVWERILSVARQGAGRVHVPVRADLEDPGDLDAVAGTAGVDLITETPLVAAWLDRFTTPLVVANHVYADGADNVRASVAVDAVVDRLLDRRGSEVSVAMLATPTDVFAVSEEAVADSRRRFADRGAGARLARTVSRGRLFAANHRDTVTTPAGRRLGIADSLIPQQGPNYTLAKRIHRWRSRLARRQGAVVSANVAPSTRTRSVTSNRLLAAAYAGAHHFGVEVFEPPTSRALMAALLVHDLHHPEAVGRPGVGLGHPLELFTEAANHGGLWRTPYAPRSALGLAAVAGMLTPGR